MLAHPGEIVNEKGVRIPNATITFPRGRPEELLQRLEKASAGQDEKAYEAVIRNLENFGDESTITSPDGQFTIDQKNSNAYFFYVECKCKGYERECRYLGQEDSVVATLSQAVRQAIEDGRPPRDVVIERRLKIVLKETGILAALEPYWARLEMNTKGDVTVFQFGPPDKITACRNVNLHKPTADQLARSLTFDVPRDKEGRFASFPDRNGVYFVPPALILRLHAPNGGFVRQRLDDFRRMYDGLPQAPEGGYLPELGFDAQAMNDWAKTCIFPGYWHYSNAYFYFKIGSYYGKGRCRNPAVEKDGSRVTLTLELEIQPDGSRNLKTTSSERFFFDQEREEVRQPGQGVSIYRYQNEPLLSPAAELLLDKQHYRIEGEVVDLEGRPLSGVKVSFPRARSADDIAPLRQAIVRRHLRPDYPDFARDRYSRFRSDLPGYRSWDCREEIQAENGRFSLDVPNLSVETRFRVIIQKDGYYSFETEFNAPAKALTAESLEQQAREKSGAEIRIDKKLRVVLEPVGYPTYLDRVQGTLSVSATGAYQVLQLGPPNRLAAAKVITVPQSELGQLRRCISLEVERTRKAAWP